MTTLADEGFLSDEVDAVVRTVRSTYGTWLLELRSLNTLLVRYQYSLRVHKESAQELVCAALYMRSLVHSQAAIVLIERGMDASARAMIRCAMEALFHLGACAKDPTTALSFLDADEVERKRRITYLHQVPDDGIQRIVADSTATEILADSQRRIEELDAHEIKVRTVATLAGLEKLYLTAYAMLSGAVHSSARDLEQHFEFDQTGEVRCLVNEPVLGDLAKLCLIVGETMILILQMAAPVFQLEVDAECEAHQAQFRALHGQDLSS